MKDEERVMAEMAERCDSIMIERCESCVCWHQGLCRYNPPVILHDQKTNTAITCYPEVMPTGWCRKYERA
jgi:hypothetical protein